MNDELLSRDLTWMALKGMRTVDLVALRKHRQVKLAKQRLRKICFGPIIDDASQNQRDFIDYKISTHQTLLSALNELALQELQYIDMIEHSVQSPPNQTSSCDIVNHLWDNFEVKLIIVPKENSDESI